MRKAIVALGLAVVMLLSISYVYAQEQSDSPKYMHMQKEKLWGPGKKLNLTPEQKEKAKELRRKFMGENAQLIGGIVAKRLELRSLWSDPKADPQAILNKEKELRGLQNQIKDKIVQYRLEFRSSLTPEQIEKLGMIRGMGRHRMMGHGREMGRRTCPGV